MAEILIIKPSSLGDVVHTLPCAAILRRAFPQANIRWLVNTEWMPLLAGNPHIDEAIEFPRRDFRGVRGALRIAPWARQLRARFKADLILDYQGLLRSALVAKLCRDGQTRVFGLSDAREGARFFYDETADVSTASHAVDRYLALTAYAVGYGQPPPANAPLSWPLPWGEVVAGFDAPERYIVLHPFSRGTGKSLTPEQVREFCRTLAPMRVVLVGRSDERISQLDNVVDLLNRTTLHELIWLIRRASFVVSVDSGPMHIAAALTPRLLSIHTWSDPRKVGPYQPEAWVWKDGALFQMKELATPGTHQPASHIAEVARFVRGQRQDIDDSFQIE